MGEKIKIPISDLMYIFELSKAIKQKSFIWYLDYVIGMDSDDYIIYTKLDPSKISVRPPIGLIINQRELSKFMKSITTEFEFSIDIIGLNYMTLLITLTETLKISVSLSIAQSKLNAICNIDRFSGIIEDDVTDSIGMQYLYGMTKNSGIKMYQHVGNYILTLFGGLIPIAKTDKLYLSLQDSLDGATFLARFRLHKKISDIIIILRYMKL